MRVVKGASSKHPSSFPVLIFQHEEKKIRKPMFLVHFLFVCLRAFFVPSTCPLFCLHAWASVLLLVWSLQASASDSVPIHHSSCSSILAALLPAFLSDRRTRALHARVQGRLGCQFLELGAWALSGRVMARPSALPSQEQGSRGTSLQTQQTSTEHRVSRSLFGSRGAQGSDR